MPKRPGKEVGCSRMPLDLGNVTVSFCEISLPIALSLCITMRLWVLLLAGRWAVAQVTDPAYDPLNKAYEALRDRNYDDAIPLFLKAVEAAPARSSIRKDLAYTYLKIGENVAARDQFREAMRLDPKDLHVALEYA